MVIDRIGFLLFCRIALIVVNLLFGATSAGEYVIALQRSSSAGCCRDAPVAVARSFDRGLFTRRDREDPVSPQYQLNNRDGTNVIIMAPLHIAAKMHINKYSADPLETHVFRHK